MSELPVEFPYRLRPEFLSTSESAFYNVLTRLIKKEFQVCSKVALQDLFFVVRPNENIQHAAKLQRKNVDFLLLWPDSLIPALAIELDYPRQAEHHNADNFFNNLFTETGLPLIHVTVQQTYDLKALTKQIKDALKKSRTANPAELSSAHTAYSPICPRCGITMVLRFDKDGPLNGKKYYGCLNFPACQETIKVGQKKSTRLT